MKINSEMKLVGSIDELNIKEKISSDIKLPGKENVKESVKKEAIDEDILVEIQDNFAEDEDDGTITSKGTPREVVVSDKPNEKQQAALDGIIDGVIERTYGYENLEVVDNVVYKNEDGVPTRQEIIQKNDKGEEVKITITYDEKGRVQEVASTKINNGRACDGYKINIAYNDDGTITVQPHVAWENENGAGIEVMVYIYPITIDQDGNKEIEGKLNGTVQNMVSEEFKPLKQE